MEHLFSRGVMTMGPSRNDATRQVGIFNPQFVSALPALRASEMQKFRWIAGEWTYENHVPATPANPAYSDVGIAKYALCEKENWICIVAPDGREIPNITFDPFSRQWMYVLTEGAYGILRSPQGWSRDSIVFSGLMTMIGVECEWRMTWTKEGDDRFAFVNEERDADGSWAYIDEWRFQRKS